MISAMPSAIEPPAGDEIHIWRIALGRGGREVARAALRELLGAYLGTPETPALATDPGGKPRLTGEWPLSFNLSHSGDMALIAIAPPGVGVGIDVERLRPRRDPVRLAARWLPTADAESVAGAAEGEREEVFHRAWTRHEARVKCTGAGLSGPPPPQTVVARQLEIGPGYAAAVAFDLDAVAGREPRITVREG